MEFLRRFADAVFMLVRLAIHIVASLACGYYLGAMVGDWFADEWLLGSRWGLGVAGFIVLAGLGDALTPRSWAEFVGWWFHSILLALVALAASVASYFLLISAAHMLRLQWDVVYIHLAAGGLALMVVLPTSAALLHVFFTPQLADFVSESVSGGLQTFGQLLKRARSVGARRTFDDGHDQ